MIKLNAYLQVSLKRRWPSKNADYRDSFFLCWVDKFRTGGKPSTWFPPGGLVEHISDDQILYKIQIAFWCKLEFNCGCEFMSLDLPFKLHRDSDFKLIFFDFRFYFRLRIPNSIFDPTFRNLIYLRQCRLLRLRPRLRLRFRPDIRFRMRIWLWRRSSIQFQIRIRI